MAGKRDISLDRLRGFAIFLMIIDHSLVLADHLDAEAPWMDCVRDTLTRLSMPLFMMVSGLLIARRGRPSLKRVPLVLGLAIIINVFSYRYVGFGSPDILALWLLCLPLYPLFVRYPVEVSTLGILQLVNWPVTFDWWESYQPGLVLTFLALGAVLAKYPKTAVLKAGEFLPRLFGYIGRRPLLWYAGHLLILVIIGAALED